MPPKKVVAKRPAAKKTPTAAAKSVKKRPAAKKSSAATSSVKKRPAAAAAKAVEEWTYDRLWDSPEIFRHWNARNHTFWSHETADIRGATGGGVSQFDLKFSRDFMAKLGAAKGERFKRVLDLGAGVGRVTEAVLRQHSSHVVLVEFVRKHLQQARKKLPAAGKAGCTFEFHQAPVQEFKVQPRAYDLVWCQWLLMYLTDKDALALLRRLGRGLGPSGILVVKENISTRELATYFDDVDGELWEDGDPNRDCFGPVSCVRTVMHYEDLFERAGLAIRAQKVQKDTDDKIMDMMLYVLTPADRGVDLDAVLLAEAATK